MMDVSVGLVALLILNKIKQTMHAFYLMPRGHLNKAMRGLLLFKTIGF